jgi:hypothetical protein
MVHPFPADSGLFVHTNQRANEYPERYQISSVEHPNATVQPIFTTRPVQKFLNCNTPTQRTLLQSQLALCCLCGGTRWLIANCKGGCHVTMINGCHVSDQWLARSDAQWLPRHRCSMAPKSTLLNDNYVSDVQS